MARKIKKQLYFASWHYTLWCLYHSAGVVCEDPNSKHPPLAVPETQDWARIASSCVCRRSSTECDSRLHSHTKTGLPEMLGMAGLWEQVCICWSMAMTRLDFIHILLTKNYDHVLGTSRSFHIQLKMCYNPLDIFWVPMRLSKREINHQSDLYLKSNYGKDSWISNWSTSLVCWLQISLWQHLSREAPLCHDGTWYPI
jgi:hypothetical protein